MIFRKARGLRRAALAAALLNLAAPAFAQQDADRTDPSIAARELGGVQTGVRPARATTRIAAEDDSAFFSFAQVPVGAILVDGAPSFRAADFAPAIGGYVGRSLTAAELKQLAKAVADFARARGYVFASAWVPEQTLSSGLLRVRLDEGRIHQVRVKGPNNAAVMRALSVLADGRPVTRFDLERAILLAGDLPGVRIRETRYQREGDQGVLIVDAESERVVARAQLDNWGTRSVGPVRARIRVEINEAMLPGDQFTLRGTVTPLQPRELATIGFDYAADTGLDGLVAGVGASYTRVRPGSDIRSLDYDGGSASFNASLSYPLLRRLDANLWATADFTVRDVEQHRGVERVRKDRLAVLTMGLSGYRDWIGGSLYGRLGARQGFDILDATKAGDPLASRSGGSAVFSKIEAYADWTGSLSGPLGLRLAAEGQLASRALLSSEEMGIGGPRFGRGYDYSERSGDRGIAGLVELRYDLKGPGSIRSTQLYAFADGGYVGNLGSSGRGGELYSAGGGLRFDLNRVFDAAIELGFPIGSDRYESGNRDPRLSLTLTSRF